MVQDPFAATEPQLSVSTKSVLGVTVKATAAAVLLLTVKVFAALVVPAATLPNAREAGEMVTGAIPVAVTLAESGLPKPL